MIFALRASWQRIYNRNYKHFISNDVWLWKIMACLYTVSWNATLDFLKRNALTKTNCLQRDGEKTGCLICAGQYYAYQYEFKKKFFNCLSLPLRGLVLLNTTASPFIENITHFWFIACLYSYFTYNSLHTSVFKVYISSYLGTNRFTDYFPSCPFLMLCCLYKTLYNIDIWACYS